MSADDEYGDDNQWCFYGDNGTRQWPVKKMLMPSPRMAPRDLTWQLVFRRPGIPGNPFLKHYSLRAHGAARTRTYFSFLFVLWLAHARTLLNRSVSCIDAYLAARSVVVV